MQRGTKTPGIITIVILTVITIFFWIGFEIYRSLTAKPAPPVPPEIISPLNPTLDLTALNQLQQRMHLSDDQIGNFTILTPGETPTPAGVPASPSALTSPPATSSAQTTESGVLTP